MILPESDLLGFCKRVINTGKWNTQLQPPSSLPVSTKGKGERKWEPLWRSQTRGTGSPKRLRPNHRTIECSFLHTHLTPTSIEKLFYNNNGKTKDYNGKNCESRALFKKNGVKSGTDTEPSIRKGTRLLRHKRWSAQDESGMGPAVMCQILN